MSVPSYPYPQFLPQNSPGVKEDRTLVNQLYYLLQALFLRTGGNSGIATTVGTPTTAVGTTQATATSLTNDVNIVTTGTGGVRLPNVQPGQFVYVFNATAAAINVYPSTGGTIDSLAVNAPFSLAAGVGQLFICTTVNASGVSTFNVFLPLPFGHRILLTGQTNFFVSTTGSDSNDGRTAATAFATVDGALNYIAQNIDGGGWEVFLHLADGTYTLSSTYNMKVFAGVRLLGIVGNVADSTKVTITSSAAVWLFQFFDYGIFQFNNITFSNTGGNQFGVFAPLFIEFTDCIFGAVANNGIAIDLGDNVTCAFISTITVQMGSSGASSFFLRSKDLSFVSIEPGCAVTQTSGQGTFAYAVHGGVISCSGATFSGSGTGFKFQLDFDGIIDTGGQGLNVFPGTGFVLTNGIYDDVNYTTQLRASGTAGIGYGPSGAGTGGSVTQLTSKATAVTLNTICGQIITSNSALGGGVSTAFVVNNSLIGTHDVVVLNLLSAAAANYEYAITQVNAGSFVIYLINVTGGSLSDALTFNFAIIKGVNS